jgi:Pectate lyase superfamily protein
MGIVLGGLALAGPPAHSAAALAVFDVTDFGATGNGVTDDSPAFRAAIAAADTAAGTNTVFIPAGTYLMDTDGNGTPGVLELEDVADVTIEGEGAASVVKYKARDWVAQSDPHLFACEGCAFVSFSDFKIDGSKDDPGFVGHSVRRMHGIELLDSHDVKVERVTFVDTWGDGVEVFGQPGITEDVMISDNVFLDNGRSGVGVQGGTRFVDILGNHFEQVRGQDIDFEPTGSLGGRPGPTDFLIQGNTIVHTSAALSVTLGGQTPTNKAKRIQFLDNIMTDGHLRMRHAEDVVVEGNSITSDSVQEAQVLSGAGDLLRVTVRDNTLEGANTGKAIIEFLADAADDGSRTLPREIAIELNEIKQLAAADAIVLDSVVGPAIVRDNEVTGSGGGEGIKYRLSYDDGILREDAEISGNTVSGFPVAAIGVHSSAGGPFSVVTVCANELSSSARGIRFELASAALLEEAVICDNVFAPSVATKVVTDKVTHFRGTGSPEGVVAAPVGSEFIRTDEANRLYLKQTGNNTTGWVGQ